MRLKKIHRFISLLMTICLMQMPPGISSAAKASEREVLSATDMTAEIFDILRPVRKHETMSEVYYRALVRMDEDEQRSVGKFLEKQGNLKAPEVKMRANEIVIIVEGKETRLKVERTGEAAADFTIFVNDVAFTDAELQMPGTRFKKIEKLVKGDKKTPNALMWSLIIPDAEANWWLVAAGAVAVGVAGFMWYKNYKKNKEAAAKGPQCSSQVASCCLQNGCYVKHTTACCQEIGALGFGIGAACPAQVAGTSTTCTSTSSTGTTTTTTTTTVTPASAAPAAIINSGQQ